MACAPPFQKGILERGFQSCIDKCQVSKIHALGIVLLDDLKVIEYESCFAHPPSVITLLATGGNIIADNK